MALLDRWRRRREEEPMPDDVRAEVEAVDAALRGDPAPGGMAGLDALVRDLRAERPTPDETYAAKLDAWAAEGFDRAKRPGKTTERPAMHGIRGTPGRSTRSSLDAEGYLAGAEGDAAAVVTPSQEVPALVDAARGS